MTLTYAIQCPYCKEVNGLDEDINKFNFERIVKCIICGNYMSVTAHIDWKVKKANHKVIKGK